MTAVEMQKRIQIISAAIKNITLRIRRAVKIVVKNKILRIPSYLQALVKCVFSHAHDDIVGNIHYVVLYLYPASAFFGLDLNFISIRDIAAYLIILFPLSYHDADVSCISNRVTCDDIVFHLFVIKDAHAVRSVLGSFILSCVTVCAVIDVAVNTDNNIICDFNIIPSQGDSTAVIDIQQRTLNEIVADRRAVSAYLQC